MTSAVILEIRAAEGGEDARLLVREQVAIYRAAGARSGFDLEIVEERSGFVLLRAEGPGAWDALRHEGGGHRWQRVPPTERRGRVHTSTVTVAVLREPEEAEVRIREGDLEWATCRASGSGGQKVNKTDSAVQLTHRPSGIQIRVETERSQKQNRRMALCILRARLLEAREVALAEDRNGARRRQVGTGMRGDKRRTYRTQDDSVHDHVLDTRARLTRVQAGHLEDIVGGEA
jgi:peptide chain release factor 1